jgi:hypothetical protein
MAEKYQEYQEQDRKIEDLSKRINIIKDTFRLVLVDGNQAAYDQFHKALDASAQIDRLLEKDDTAKNRREIDRQLLIGRISMDKVDVFLQSQTERLNALQEEENRAMAEGRTSMNFITELGKYKKVIELRYKKPRGYYASGGVEVTPHMKVKFPDVWYKEKKQAADKFLTLLEKKAVVINGFKSLESNDQGQIMYSAIKDIADMKTPNNKAFLKIAAKYDEDTIYGPEGALNILLGMQRALSCMRDGGFEYLCADDTDRGKNKNKLEIYLLNEVKPQVQPVPKSEPVPVPGTRPIPRQREEEVEPEPFHIIRPILRERQEEIEPEPFHIIRPIPRQRQEEVEPEPAPVPRPRHRVDE